MKKLLVSIFFVVMGHMLWAQQVNTTTILVDTTQQPALSVSFQQDDEAVKEVLEKEIKDNNGKYRTRKKMMYTTRSIKLPELGNDAVNVYYMITSQGRKKKEVTTVAMAVQQDDGTFVGNDNVAMHTRINIYLSGLERKVQLYLKDIEIAQLRKELKKLNDDIKDARKDQQKSVDKKLKQIEELQSRLNALNN